MDWYRKAADQGDPVAQHFLSRTHPSLAQSLDPMPATLPPGLLQIAANPLHWRWWHPTDFHEKSGWPRHDGRCPSKPRWGPSCSRWRVQGCSCLDSRLEKNGPATLL